MTVNSAYFASASVLSLIAGIISPVGWIFIVALIVSALILLCIQQYNCIYSLLNPTYERFGQLKKGGVELIAAKHEREQTFTHILQVKQDQEEKVETRATPSETHTVTSVEQDYPASTATQALPGMGLILKRPDCLWAASPGLTNTCQLKATQAQTVEQPLSDYQSDQADHHVQGKARPNLLHLSGAS